MELNERLATNPTNKHVLGTPVLAEQPPARWILINLVGDDSCTDRTTIAMRDDNLYIVGFKTIYGSWFVFKGCKAEFPATLAASELSFGGGYRDLVDQHTNLSKYDMSKQAAFDAVRLLAMHREEYSDDDKYEEKLKIALAQLCVMLAEGARLTSISDTIHEGWDPQEAKEYDAIIERGMEATLDALRLLGIHREEVGDDAEDLEAAIERVKQAALSKEFEADIERVKQAALDAVRLLTMHLGEYDEDKYKENLSFALDKLCAIVTECPILRSAFKTQVKEYGAAMDRAKREEEATGVIIRAVEQAEEGQEATEEIRAESTELMISEKQAKLVVLWGSMSEALLVSPTRLMPIAN